MDPDRRLKLAYLAAPQEILARDWMASFARRGHDVTLIVRAGFSGVDGLDPRISIREMRPYAGRLFGRLSALDSRGALREALASLRPDILHVHDLTTGFGWTAFLSGFHPLVVTAWGSDIYLAAGSSWPARTARRLTLRAADLVTLEGRDLGRAAVRSGARPGRVRVIQFGVDTERFRPGPADPTLRATLGLANRRVIFAPRQIAPLYDQVSVVRAVGQMPEDIALLMSTRHADPGYLRTVEDAARDSGVGGRLLLVPAIDHDDMARYLGLADVVVSVPRSDSISVSVLEAMASGKPVVVSDLPSPREWLADVSPDLIVPFGDVPAIRAAIQRALELSPDEAATRGAASRRIVTDRAERETNMATMEGLYWSLVEARRRPA
jgi:glycosyltransferase involved in cell wall biosynthesis